MAIDIENLKDFMKTLLSYINVIYIIMILQITFIYDILKASTLSR